MKKTLKLNAVEVMALRKLVEYAEEAESVHYAESGYPTDHIFLSVIALWRALKKANLI